MTKLIEATTILTKVLFPLLLLGIIYNLWFLAFPFEKETTYTNIERAEEFIYSRKRYSVVFLGSGLIGNFNKQLTNRRNSFNFNLPYNGSCTGVKILAISNNIPDTAFIEINYIHKGFDENLINQVFKPYLYKVKYFVPILQKKYRPLSVLKHAFNMGNKQIIELDKYPDDVFQKYLKINSQEYNNIDSIKIQRNIKELKIYTDHLSSKGCVIIFFEIPVDKSLEYSPLYNLQRKLIINNFHSKNVGWIKADNSNTYYTVDGTHLLKKSIVEYMRYFNRCILQNNIALNNI